MSEWGENIPEDAVKLMEFLKENNLTIEAEGDEVDGICIWKNGERIAETAEDAEIPGKLRKW